MNTRINQIQKEIERIYQTETDVRNNPQFLILVAELANLDQVDQDAVDAFEFETEQASYEYVYGSNENE